MNQRRRTKTNNAPTANAESDEIDDTVEDLAGGSNMERAKREVEAMGKVRLARNTPESEREALVKEYRELAGYAHHGTISRSQECRLSLVRWQLDRIRDAEIGPALDFWERAAADQRRLAVLAALDTLPDDETRRRSLAASAILLGVVSPEVVIRELRRAGVG